MGSSETPTEVRQRRISAYRRNARRCRGQGDLVQVHADLARLNQTLDESLNSSKQEAYERFTRLTAARMEGGVLRYTNRQDLLRQASELGISRFDALLLIAAVQHAASEQTPPLTTPRLLSASAIPVHPKWPWLLALGIELALVAGAWLAFVT